MAAPNILEQIKTFFTRYTLQQKLMLAGSAALVMVMMWLLVFFMNRVEYQTLYADLDPQEAQGIVQKVQELKIPYQLSEDGRTIKVASDKLSEVRIQLASQLLVKTRRGRYAITDDGSSIVEPHITALFEPKELDNVCAETPSVPEARATPEMKVWADAYKAKFGSRLEREWGELATSIQYTGGDDDAGRKGAARRLDEFRVRMRE